MPSTNPKFTPAARQFGQDSDPEAGGAFGSGQEILVGPGGPCDIQVRPGYMVGNKLFEEDSAGNGPRRTVA